VRWKKTDEEVDKSLDFYTDTASLIIRRHASYIEQIIRQKAIQIY